MRVWLITVGEPLPTDDANNRLLRTGFLANLLYEKGHDVLWWTSSYDHNKKKHRSHADTTLAVNDRYHIRLLHSVGYKRNVSIQRLINHYMIARKFIKSAGFEKKPDIILCSLPTLELSLAAVEYGRKEQIPVILDMRDMWPDIFENVFPLWSRKFVRLLLLPMFQTVRSACKNATAIVGITQDFVDWGVNHAGRSHSSFDKEFPLAYSNLTPSHGAMLEAAKFWERHKVNKENKEFNVCFFGYMGRQIELETVIEAARKLLAQKRKIRFILCGDGDQFSQYKEMARGCDNIIFPGWVGAPEIWALMRLSSAGLAPYRSSKDFQASLPNKSIEYLSAGLPIISSLKGALQQLLSVHDCGITYDNTDSDQLVKTLKDLYDDGVRLDIMSGNASALYGERFVSEKVYGHMVEYLEAVYENSRNQVVLMDGK